MFAAFSIRANAIALIPTIMFLQVFGKTDFEQGNVVQLIFKGLKRIQFLDLIPYVVFAIGTIFISINLSDPVSSYASTGHVEVGGLKRLYFILKTGFIYYAKLPNAFFDAPALVYGLVIVPVLLFGVIRRGLRNQDLLIFAVFHMAILILYPGRQGLRFILPILPIMLFFLFVGSSEFGNWLSRNWRNENRSRFIDGLMVAALFIGIAGPVILNSIQHEPSPISSYVASGPYSENSQDVFDYIRNNSGEDDSIVFWKPRVLSYFTNRRSAFAVSLEDLTSGRYGYVLVFLTEYSDEQMGRLLVTVTSSNPENFRPIYNNREFVLYRILSSDKN